MTNHNNVGTGTGVVGSVAGGGGGSSSLAVGTTPVTNGTTTRVLYDAAGTLGEYQISGTGKVVMDQGATPIYPGGAIIGRDANNTSRQYYGAAIDSGNQLKVPKNGTFSFNGSDDNVLDGIFANLAVDSAGLWSTNADRTVSLPMRSLSHRLDPGTAPANPASGWVLYVDTDDGDKLKAKSSTGTVVTLGTP